MLIAGIVMIPYPGPGWLVVFAALGILATEFAWAQRINSYVKRYYVRWTAWLGRQPLGTRLAVAAATAAIVVATLWLLGLFAEVGGWLGIDWPWLASPLLGR